MIPLSFGSEEMKSCNSRPDISISVSWKEDLLSENDSIMKFSFFEKEKKKTTGGSLGKKCLQGKTQKWLKRKGSQKYHCENILKSL